MIGKKGPPAKNTVFTKQENSAAKVNSACAVSPKLCCLARSLTQTLAQAIQGE